MQKDTTITDLIAALPLRERGWVVVEPDPWEADLCAVGIGRCDQPRHLVYVCSFKMGPGRYYYECEAPTGSDETDYEVVEEGDAVSFDALLGAMTRHLDERTSHGEEGRG